MNDIFLSPAIESVHTAAGLTTSNTAPKPTPGAIIAEHRAHYIVCFEPDVAGIVTSSPQTMLKDFVAGAYLEIVDAWDKRKRDDWNEALRIKQSITDYACFFRTHQHTNELARREPGVACDQKLLAGMRRHWGELRQCATHPQERDFAVCKGCRVAHHSQPDRGFDCNVLMTEGARVPVCKICAERAVLNLGVGYRSCVCDRDWTCFRCRENFLEKLAVARKRLQVEGKCGICGDIGEAARHVEVCLFCQGVVVYT